MTKHSKLTKTDDALNIVYFPIGSLTLHEMNPRQDDDDQIVLLAESITTCGLLQNLNGIEDGNGKIGIVAGGRRLKALQLLNLDVQDKELVVFAKLTKTEKAEALENLFSDPEFLKAQGCTSEQLTQIAEWLPECV